MWYRLRPRASCPGALRLLVTRELVMRLFSNKRGMLHTWYRRHDGCSTILRKLYRTDSVAEARYGYKVAVGGQKSKVRRVGEASSPRQAQPPLGASTPLATCRHSQHAQLACHSRLFPDRRPEFRPQSWP